LGRGGGTCSFSSSFATTADAIPLNLAHAGDSALDTAIWVINNSGAGLSANTQYNICLKPTTAGAITAWGIASFDGVDASGSFTTTSNAASSASGTAATGSTLPSSPGDLWFSVVGANKKGANTFDTTGTDEFGASGNSGASNALVHAGSHPGVNTSVAFTISSADWQVLSVALPTVPAPILSTAVWNDPDDNDTAFSAGDTLTLTFDIATNAPSVSNQAEIDPIVNVAGLFGTTATYSGAWSAGNTVLTITINSVGTASSVIGGNVGPGVTSVTNAAGTSVVWSNTISSTGDFGVVVVPCTIETALNVDTIISSSCTLSASSTAPANVIVQNNSVLTIPNGVTLTVPSGHNITVVSGSGILIKSGGTLRITV